jgi:hypothetical protein
VKLTNISSSHSVSPYRKGRRLIAFAEHAIRAGRRADAESLIRLAYRQFDQAPNAFDSQPSGPDCLSSIRSR